MPEKKKQKKFKSAKLIYNPGAGDPKYSSAKLEQLVRCLDERDISVDVAVVHPKTKATSIARQAAKDEFKLVIAAGGDGTVEAVARGLIGSKTYLGILPTGTYNNIARSLGVPEDLASACDLLKQGYKRRLDVGQVKSKKKGKFYFFEVSITGLAADLLPQGQEIYKGDWLQVGTALNKLVHYKTPKVMVRLDGESQIKIRTLMVTIANAPVFGLRFMEAPEASMEDGLLDINVYPGFSKADLVAHFTRIMNGGFPQDERIQRYRARKVKIKSKPKMHAMADAEMLGKGNFKFRLLPGKLRVIGAPETGLAKEPPPESEQLPAPVAPVPVSTDQGGA